jgi:hypothetical protein
MSYVHPHTYITPEELLSKSDGWIKEHRNDVDWKYISRKNDLSDEFIRVFQHILNMPDVLRYNELSEELLYEIVIVPAEKYYTPKNTAIIDGVIAGFRDRATDPDASPYHYPKEVLDKAIQSGYFNFNTLIINRMCQYQTLSESFIREHHLCLCWGVVLQHQKLTEAVIQFIADEYVTGAISNEILSATRNVDIKQLKQFSGKTFWKYVSKYIYLSEPFMIRYAEFLDWVVVSTAQNMSMLFMAKFADKLHWSSLVCAQSMNNEFILEFAEYLHGSDINYIAQMGLIDSRTKRTITRRAVKTV